MSYDVYIGGRDRNITSNIGAYFAWALHDVEDDDPASRCDSRDGIFGKARKGGLKDLDGMGVGDALPLISKAIAKTMAADGGWLTRFDSPNGWGTCQGGLEFLRWMRETCEAAIKDDVCPHCGKCTSTIRVSW